MDRKPLSQDQIAYDLLSLDTMQHADERFIHQYIVDAYTAQTATLETKPIKIVFALVGLYLHVEHHYTGRQIQDAHMILAQGAHDWPAVVFPTDHGSITAAMILKYEHGEKRNNMIEMWAAAVWFAWKESHQVIRNLVQDRLGIAPR